MSRANCEIRFRNLDLEIECNVIGGSDNIITKYGQPIEQPYEAEIELLHVCVGEDSVDILDLLDTEVCEGIKNACLLSWSDNN
jgi:hypothetical protein